MVKFKSADTYVGQPNYRHFKVFSAVTSIMGKVSLMDKMRVQTLGEQRLGAKAKYYYDCIPGQGLGAQHSEEDLPAC